MTTAPRVAYHGDPDLKRSVLSAMAEHRVAEELVQGKYWDGRCGCAVGCLTHDPDGGHHLYPDLWGIPVELALLEDVIFEYLPYDEEALTWPERFLDAIPVGADLSRVYAEWVSIILLDPECGCVARCAGYPDAEAVVRRAGELWSHDRVATAEWDAVQSDVRAMTRVLADVRQSGGAEMPELVEAQAAVLVARLVGSGVSADRVGDLAVAAQPVRVGTRERCRWMGDVLVSLLAATSRRPGSPR